MQQILACVPPAFASWFGSVVLVTRHIRVLMVGVTLEPTYSKVDSKITISERSFYDPPRRLLQPGVTNLMATLSPDTTDTQKLPMQATKDREAK